MPPPKRTTDEVPLTVRTAPDHRQVVDLLADRFGVSRSDMAAIVLADALGLERPAGKPRISLPRAMSHLVAELVREQDEEVMAHTA